MVSGIVAWLERNMLSCPYKRYLGVDCPGCGMQRSVIQLIKGDLWGSVVAYPALIPLMALLVFLALHLKFKFAKGSNIVKYLFIFAMTIVVIHFIFKQTIKL